MTNQKHFFCPVCKDKWYSKLGKKFRNSYDEVVPVAILMGVSVSAFLFAFLIITMPLLLCGLIGWFVLKAMGVW